MTRCRVAVTFAGCAVVVAGCGGATRTVTETVARTAAAQTRPTVVLGSKDFMPGGDGWGTAEPSRIYNGGDRSGLVANIHWTNWGQSTAVGTGSHAIFKPGGGYYPQLVTSTLRASDIGSCTKGGPRAYRKLSIESPERPGGPLRAPVAWAGAPDLCSTEVVSTPESTETVKPTTTSTASTPAPEPQTFKGNGVRSLGTIRVSTPSTLEWSCSACKIFSVTGSASGGPVIALFSSKHSSGVSAVEPGTYHSVDVQAFEDKLGGAEWTITITPR